MLVQRLKGDCVDRGSTSTQRCSAATSPRMSIAVTTRPAATRIRRAVFAHVCHVSKARLRAERSRENARAAVFRSCARARRASCATCSSGDRRGWGPGIRI